MAQLVGILNVTPDSFSDGGQFNDAEAAFLHAVQLFSDGAALVDVGAESTRPGAVALSTEEEWHKLYHLLQQLIVQYPEQISLDTYHPETAAKAFGLGTVIINDVTGLVDPAMVEIALTHNARCVVGYMPDPDIQTAHELQVDSVQQVTDSLLARAESLQEVGLDRDNIILDPCIGFGKTPELNRRLLRFAEQVPDYPVMIGYSRKRFLGEKRMELEPNLEAGRIALAAGAAYLRVHDVAAHRQLIY